MDHAAWLERLRAFVGAWQGRLPPGRESECYVRADPPLSPEQLGQLREGLDCPLPPSVEQFLTRVASRLRVRCTCLPPGRPATVIGWELFNYWVWSPEERPYEEQFVGPVEGMAYARDVARTTGDHMGDPECVLDRAFWHHALPLMLAPNTDALALWAYDPELAEPPVLCLHHDDYSFLLSPTFDDFLAQVEQLGYDYGDEYRDTQTGLMDVEGPAAVARRALLGLPG